MARESEFLALGDAALRAVIGPNSRHVALIEDAFKVLVEAPGGGVSINGSARDRAQAKRVIQTLADRADAGAAITESDVRAALGAAVAAPRPGQGRVVPDGVALPVGRRGAIAPKTAAQALPTEQEEPLAVTIAADGSVSIMTTPVALDELIPRLKAIAAERRSDKLFLRADGAIPYETVMQVMGALNAGGFANIGLVTDTGGPRLDGSQPGN